MSEYSEWSKRREIWFLAGVRMHACVYVCVWVCVRAQISNYQTTIIHKRLEISSWNLVQKWSSHAPSIVTIFTQIDAQLKILWNLKFFKNVRSSSNFREIWAIVLKMHPNIIYQWRIFGIEFYQIDWSVQIFWDFDFFEIFL